MKSRLLTGGSTELSADYYNNHSRKWFRGGQFTESVSANGKVINYPLVSSCLICWISKLTLDFWFLPGGRGDWRQYGYRSGDDSRDESAWRQGMLDASITVVGLCNLSNYGGWFSMSRSMFRCTCCVAVRSVPPRQRRSSFGYAGHLSCFLHFFTFFLFFTVFFFFFTFYKHLICICSLCWLFSWAATRIVSSLCSVT